MRYMAARGPAREAAKESQRKLEEAAHDITDVLDRAFTALGDTIRDEIAKNDLKAAVKALGDAVAVTVSEAGEQVRRRVGTSPHADQRDATTPDGGEATEQEPPRPA